MPSIDVSMVRSLAGRRTLLDVLTAALQPVLYGRDVASVEGQITDVKTAYSSWDNCMQADICKWPVIAIIIVGSLFILSIVWCIVRCCCCGLSCCCECCYCLKCCGNCLGCCDPPRGKPHKYLDEPYIPPHQGYRSEAPMVSGAMSAAPAYKAPVHDAPQYADFDVSKPGARGGEDALPAMPSWENASSKKVYLEDESVEMENLKKPENTGQNVPLMAGNTSPGVTSPGPRSPNPNNPYTTNTTGDGGHPAVSNGYLAAGAIPAIAGAGAADSFGRSSPGYTAPQQSGMVDHGADYGRDYGYGAPAMGPGRQSPRQYNDQQRPGYGASPPPQQQQPGYGRNNQGGSYYDEYRRNGSGTPMGQQPYGADRRSPRIPDMGIGSSNVPPSGPDYGVGAGPGRYGSPGPYGGPNSRSPSNGRPLNARPPPQRQFSGSAMGSNRSNGYDNSRNNNSNNYGGATMPAMPASPTLQNNAGFDFSSGYSRPSNRGQDDFNDNDNGYGNVGRPINHSISPPPPPAQPQAERTGYPGYRAYRG